MFRMSRMYIVWDLYLLGRPMIDQFVHLHVHSDYSMLDGAAKIDRLFSEAQRLGQPALAITDHGNLFGAAEFWRVSRNFPTVKPIIGMEAYCAPASRSLREPVFWGEGDVPGGDVSSKGAYTHITLLAENETGLRNLFCLSTRASAEGSYYKPRVDRELLAEYSEGLIATTGCPGGEVSTRLALGQYREALAAASDLRDIFGPDNYFLELMDHHTLMERRLRPDLLRIASELNLQPLVTNDSHYVTADQADIHDALLCVQTQATLDKPDRFKFEGSGYYLKSAEEMRYYWDVDVPVGCNATLAIAERVGFYADIFTPRDLMPKVKLLPGETEDDTLQIKVSMGADRLTVGQRVSEVYRQRVNYELDMIKQMGFAGYFLVVADLVSWARSQGIAIGPGRGSAAGSLVCYLLGITGLDPIAHGLLFERFLNPERVSPPDIDLDFGYRRDEVINYVTEKYGAENVARVITFGRILTRAALKDAARVLHGSAGYAIAERIAGALPPPIHAIDVSLSEIDDPDSARYGECNRLRNLLAVDQEAAVVAAIARDLEGLVRNAGVHACGLILSSEPLIDVLPLWTRQADGAVITGWSYEDCEALGLQKIDILGSRTMGVLDECSRTVGIELATIPLDDKPTFDLLATGNTAGVFQLESAGTQKLLRQIKPSKFSDISVVVALYRPGPMGMGAHEEYSDRKTALDWPPIHPELTAPLAGILDETYGLFVYQEQIMAAARAVAGYSLGRADILRRAMGKKKKAVLDSEHDGFFAGMTKNGYSVTAAEALWNTMEPFASYSFVRAHATSYAMIGYWCAYFKAHYPVAFIAAQLSSVSTDPDRRNEYLAECRRMGMTVLPPDVNSSKIGFTVAKE